MDSPQLLHLALLLLALAAPCPNVAMSIVGPAEGTEDSSTQVSVYRCKDCNSCPCKAEANDFEEFEIIADTQNQTFSDQITMDLVTNEKHTTVCFKEPNFCHEVIYGIFWQKPEGSGLSCGILSSGGNGHGDISTEQKTICCEAETDTKKHNPKMKCFYTEMPHPKLNISPDAIRSEGVSGNPEFLTSKKNSTGILFAFLFVGVCAGWGTMYYCLRLRRRGQAFRACRQVSEGDVVLLAREPSTRKETPLTAASSSLSECTATS